MRLVLPPTLTDGGWLHTIAVAQKQASSLRMNKQVFYDPQRKRWKRLRRIFDVAALLGLVLGSIFVVDLVRMKPRPELFLHAQKRNYKALANQNSPVLKLGQKLRRSAHRKTDRKPSDVP